MATLGKQCDKRSLTGFIKPLLKLNVQKGAGFIQPFLKLNGRERNGFTLIELVMVIVLIGILMVFLIPKAKNIYENTYVSLTKSEMSEIVKAIIGDADTAHQGFITHMKRPPKDSVGYEITELCSDVDSVGFNHITQTGWDGPYIADMDNDGTVDADEETAILNDSWDNAYDYSLNTGTRTITITSNGPDGTASTADDIIVTFTY